MITFSKFSNIYIGYCKLNPEQFEFEIIVSKIKKEL